MEEDKKYIRKVQCSVTNFLHCGDDYLFIHRNANKRVDPNRLNGIGGRLEPGEDFLSAAIRETKEETGYVVSVGDISLAGVVKLDGGYGEDWVMCFFKIKVDSKNIPSGNESEDGKLIWLDKDKVLDSEYELVDDLNYSFKDIVAGTDIFFMAASLNDNEKIENVSVGKLSARK